MWPIDIQIGIQTRIRIQFFSPIFPLRCLCCSLPAIVLSPSVPNQGSGVWSGVTMWQCYFTGWRGEVRWGEGGPPRHCSHHNTVSSELPTRHTLQQQQHGQKKTHSPVHFIIPPWRSNCCNHIWRPLRPLTRPIVFLDWFPFIIKSPLSDYWTKAECHPRIET